ncbi:MAG TPA: YebC/PmpR family DNA-binding transcriptional regulator [Candidatus Polarisedimenticolaceae bacterium]
MSGHSKWHTIKHKKAAIDAKRGRAFTRLIKEITVAARMGGGDPDANPRLRLAVAEAKSNNMPADNIKRAIQKGTGELPGVSYEEITYEGYGPGGVAILVDVLTDNKMRTTPEIRHLFAKHGGNLGDPNSVAWMFERKGRFVVPASTIGEDRLMEIALEAGADDLEREGDAFTIYTDPTAFADVQQALEKAGVAPSESGFVKEAKNMLAVDSKKAQQNLKLLEVLEDHDDVQHVFANLDFDEAELASEAD